MELERKDYNEYVGPTLTYCFRPCATSGMATLGYYRRHYTNSSRPVAIISLVCPSFVQRRQSPLATLRVANGPMVACWAVLGSAGRHTACCCVAACESQGRQRAARPCGPARPVAYLPGALRGSAAWRAISVGETLRDWTSLED